MCEGEPSISRLWNKIDKDIFFGFKKFLLSLINSINALLVMNSSCKSAFVNTMILNMKTRTHLRSFEQLLAVCLDCFPNMFLDQISVNFLFLTI